MLRNDLKSAIRSLRRHAGYSVINVVGLTVGIGVCLLIALYIHHELSYDDFHEDADRIVRVVSDWGDFSVPATNPPMVRTLRTEWPDVPITTLFQASGLVAHEETRFEEDDIYFASPEFFDVFSFSLLRGSREEALQRPLTVLITPDLAEKYFGDEDPIGQTLLVDNQVEAEVTGIVESAPETSHFHYDMLVSWVTAEQLLQLDYSQDWGRNALYTYAKFPSTDAISHREAQLPEIIDRHAGDDWNGARLSLQPITSIHLHSHHNSELEPNGNAAYIWLFGVVALFVLVLACVNFTNLATARGLERAREVGVRKSVGAGRGQLIRQFLIEAFVLSAIALILAVGVALAALPFFQTLTGVSVSVGVLAEPFAGGALVVISVVAALGAGGYPAFVLSRFDPVSVLRGRSNDGGRGAWARKGLVVFQFTTAVVLIAGTLVAFSQLDYLRSANLGFDQERVVAVEAPANPTQGDTRQRFRTFKQELLQNSEIESVSIASEGFPSELLNGAGMYVADAGVPPDSSRSMRMVDVGKDFFETIGVSIVAGRTFRGEPDSTWSFVVNRAAYEVLAGQLQEAPAGPEDLAGREVMSGWRGGSHGRLLGVVENFNYSTLHETIEPIVFFREGRNLDTYLVRLSPNQTDAGLAAVQDSWQRVFPDWPFQYQFADQAFDAAYRAEQQMGRLFGVFASLAILIACLGLFGLAAYTTRQRTKEIGIRKAVGASTPHIVGLLTKDFALLVVGAIAVAIPLAYVGLSRWLETFAYHVNLNAGIFLVAGGGALAVAVLTVALHAFRAARIDPAITLRDE